MYRHMNVKFSETLFTLKSRGEVRGAASVKCERWQEKWSTVYEYGQRKKHSRSGVHKDVFCVPKLVGEDESLEFQLF